MIRQVCRRQDMVNLARIAVVAPTDFQRILRNYQLRTVPWNSFRCTATESPLEALLISKVVSGVVQFYFYAPRGGPVSVSPQLLNNDSPRMVTLCIYTVHLLDEINSIHASAYTFPSRDTIQGQGLLLTYMARPILASMSWALMSVPAWRFHPTS